MDLEKSEYELLREKNLKEQEALFESMFKEVEEFNNDFSKELEEPKLKQTPVKVKKKTPSRDRSMRFRVDTPTETRKSVRIVGKQPKYNFNDIEEIYETTTIVRKVNKVSDLSKFSFKKNSLKVPSYKLQTSKVEYENNNTSSSMQQMHEITDETIAKILDKVGNKVCSKDGTFCHQCKLTSLDTKTICRSGYCVGVRGQFCGPCLKTRYNEYVAIALKDLNWKCPPCRQICNCSTCQNNKNDSTEIKHKTDLGDVNKLHNSKLEKEIMDIQDIPDDNHSNNSDIFMKYKNNLRKNSNYEEILDDGNLLGYNKKQLIDNSRLKQLKITTAFFKQQKLS